MPEPSPVVPVAVNTCGQAVDSALELRLNTSNISKRKGETMQRRSAGRVSALLRGTLLVIACLAGTEAGWRLVRAPLGPVAGLLVGHGWGAVTTLGFADVLTVAMALVLVVCGGWLVTVTLLSALAAMVRACLPSAGAGAAVRSVCVLGGLADALDRWSPRVVRRAVALALGAAVTAGLAAPALAAPTLAAPAERGRLDGLQVPDRVTGTGTASASALTLHGRAPGPDHPPRRVVVVADGDSLWSIAADLIGPAAADARVDRAWHLLYRANRHTVGSDPDLIDPGDRLTVPDLTVPDRKEAP
jgi:resuscitation-promoting factor RpfA